MNTFVGFLVSVTRYGDQDAILHLVTQDFGFQSFYVRNIYTQRNKKKPYLSLLNELQITTSQGSIKGDLKTVRSLDLVSETQLYADFKAQSIVFFIAEICNSVLRNEEDAHASYQHIKELRKQLEKGFYHVHLVFLILLLKNLGSSPLFSEHHFLNPEEGAFGNDMYNRYFTQEISDIWKAILQSHDPFSVEIKNQSRKVMLDSILIYYHIHVPGFNMPKSLEVLQQIFES